MLSDRKVRTAPPGKHYDGGGAGLLLLVLPDGRRRWVQRVTIAGKQRELGHGLYPQVSLAAARLAASAAKDAALAGGDPIAERRAGKAARKAASAAQGRTLADAAAAFLAAHGAPWKAEARREFRSRLDRHAAVIMGKPVASLSVEDIRGCLAAIWLTKAPTAQALRSNLRHVFDYARAAGWRAERNPALWDGTLKPLLAKPSAIHRQRHHAALDWRRVPAFLAALGKVEGRAARALELTILSAARSGEVRGMRWGEVDFAAKVWTVPAVRMKAGREHRVPLSDAALAILKAARAALSKGEALDPGALVFPSAKNTIMSDFRLLAVLNKMDEATEGGWRDPSGAKITVHGMRAAFKSWCGDAGQPRELAELSLAHALGDEVEQAYQRSDLLERRRVLMDKWAAHCAARPDAADRVVPLSRLER
jgi:integrase